MKRIAACLAFCLFATLAHAEEATPVAEVTPGGAPTPAPAGEAAPAAATGEHGEVKKPPSLKPRPDSVISTVLQLPVVRKWGEWMDGKNDGSSLAIWGEALKTVQGYDCWGVAVGEDSKDGVRVWRRFCVQKTGLEIWVESVPVHDGDEITYTPYDNWQLKCNPTPSSAGSC